jgi:hypothetical protein
MLKHGYYLKDGMKTIFKEMLLVEYVPVAEDMPEILDETSRKYLLQEYHQLKQKGKESSTPKRL